MEKEQNRDDNGILGNMSKPRKLMHLAFWVLVFYGLAAGIWMLAEWADSFNR